MSEARWLVWKHLDARFIAINLDHVVSVTACGSGTTVATTDGPDKDVTIPFGVSVRLMTDAELVVQQVKPALSEEERKPIV